MSLELHEGCEKRGGICDCNGRPCAVDDTKDRGGELVQSERILVTEMAEALEKQRVKLYQFLMPMPIHRPETHQLEGALKSLDVAIGLLRAVS